MVVFSHFFEWREAFKVTGAFARFMTFLGDPGVAVFFFLSGYALFSKYKDKPTDKEYIYKRLGIVTLAQGMGTTSEKQKKA